MLLFKDSFENIDFLIYFYFAIGKKKLVRKLIISLATRSRDFLREIWRGNPILIKLQSYFASQAETCEQILSYGNSPKPHATSIRFNETLLHPSVTRRQQGQLDELTTYNSLPMTSNIHYLLYVSGHFDRFVVTVLPTVSNVPYKSGMISLLSRELFYSNRRNTYINFTQLKYNYIWKNNPREISVKIRKKFERFDKSKKKEIRIKYFNEEDRKKKHDLKCRS